jgi:hypothetical protein
VWFLLLLPRWFFSLYKQRVLCGSHPAEIDCTQVETSAEILKQSMGARNRIGIGLSYRSARLHRLAESITWNRFRGSLKV